MPTVQYKPNQVSTQVTNSPLPSVNVSAANSEINNAFSSALSDYKQATDRIEISKAEEALVNFERDKNKLFFNPDNGYFNTEGADAFNGAQNVNKELVKLKELHSKNLQSSTARNAFDSSVKSHITRSNVQIMRHASRGQKVYEQSIINSRIENARENVALHWNDEKEVSLYREVGKDAILDNAKLRGTSSEQLAEDLQSFDSEIFTAVIESAIASSSVEGEEALSKHGKFLEGNLGAKLKTALDRKKNSEKQQELATQTITISDAVIANSQSQTDILEMVKSIDDPELRDKVKKKAISDWKLIKAAESEERIELFDDVSKFKNGGGSIEEYIASNPDQWGKLSAKQQQSLINGTEDNPDMVAFTNFMSLPPSKIKQMSNEEIENVMMAFPSSLRDDLSRKIVSSRKGGPDGKIPTMIAKSNKNAVEKLFGVGILSNRKDNNNADDKIRADQFLRFVSDEYLFRKSQKGEELTPAEYDDLLGDMTRDVVTGEGLFGFNEEQNLSELSPESTNRNTSILRSLDLEVNADTLFEVENIVSELEKRAKPVTPANIKFLLEN